MNRSSFNFSRPSVSRQQSFPFFTQSVCPVCFSNAGRKKMFYCQKCFLTKSLNNREHSAEMILSSIQVARKRRIDLLDHFEKLISQSKATRLQKIQTCRLEIFKLRNKVDKLKYLNEEKAERLSLLRTTNKDYQIAESKHRKKFSRASDNLYNLETKVPECAGHLSKGKYELKNMQWRLVKDLCQNVVVVSRIDSASSADVAVSRNTYKEEPEAENMIAQQLAEAQRWAYINGHWVEANPAVVVLSNGYKILTAIIPPDGSHTDYKPFAIDLLDQDTSFPSNDSSFSSQSSGVMLSKDLAIGFSYMNLLVVSVAAIFQLILPFPLAIMHKDVLCGRLTCKDFQAYTARTAANVCFLCSAIGLDSISLRTSNPAHNLCLLADYIQEHNRNTIDELRQLPIEIQCELLRLLDIPNADLTSSNVASPLCAANVDTSLFECITDDEDWVNLASIVTDNYGEHFENSDSSFMASTNPLLPSTITSAFFSFIRGRRTSQS